MLILHSILPFLLCRYQYRVFATSVDCPSTQIEGIPQYVIDYAPLVWLDKEETYYPSDLTRHLENTLPYVNLTAINPPPPLSLDNLDLLNQFGNNESQVFLTLKDPIENKPQFLLGVVPDESRETKDATSCVIIVNDHGNGSVDAFYMYFYAFDGGNIVLSQELGNHVGDWEHNMIRFKDGMPDSIWFSQHSFGEAFRYTAVEKNGDRPVSYSARGTHANYAVAGDIDRKFPQNPDFKLSKGFLADHTSRGKLWDPVKSAYFYTFDANSKLLGSVNDSPIGFLNFKGRWGDAEYPDNQHGQRSFFGFKRYASGPTGPMDKQLNRTEVCPEAGIPCKVLDSLMTQT